MLFLLGQRRERATSKSAVVGSRPTCVYPNPLGVQVGSAGLQVGSAGLIAFRTKGQFELPPAPSNNSSGGARSLRDQGHRTGAAIFAVSRTARSGERPAQIAG
jgi:hypothetical protein